MSSVQKIFILLFLVFLSACSMLQSNNLANSQKLAIENGFQYAVLETKEFKIASFYRGLEKNKTGKIHIYIEGDGFAWKRRNKASSDPTPKTSLVLELAVADSANTVVYLARPCQYLLKLNDQVCTKSLWTSHRYSTKVIEVMNDAIDEIITISGGEPRLILIGYSGGGTVASLIASRRKDIAKLVTIAGNLDHKAWTDYHGDTSLYGSENPVDVARDIMTIPQLHLFGKEDINVPINVVRLFFDKQSWPANLEVKVIDSFNHSCCWVDKWPELLQENI